MRKAKIVSLSLIMALIFTFTSCAGPRPDVTASINTDTESVTTETSTENESESESMSENYTDKDTETETEPTPEEMAQVEDFISLCDYRYNVKETHDFKGGKEYSVYFELPENAEMLSFYFGSLQDTNSNIHVSIHKTEKLAPSTSSLPESAHGETVYSEVITSIPFYTYQVYFEEDENTDQYHYVSTSVITLGKLFGEKISEHID